MPLTPAEFKKGATNAGKMQIPDDVEDRVAAERLSELPGGGVRPGTAGGGVRNTKKVKKKVVSTKKKVVKKKRAKKTATKVAPEKPVITLADDSVPEVNLRETHIDDLAPPEEEAHEEYEAEVEIPPELIEHACGLPAALMDKKTLANYLITHKVDHKARTKIDVRQPERELYEIYSRSKRTHRTPLQHFVVALRLWRARYPLSPKDALNLEGLAILK